MQRACVHSSPNGPQMTWSSLWGNCRQMTETTKASSRCFLGNQQRLTELWYCKLPRTVLGARSNRPSAKIFSKSFPLRVERHSAVWWHQIRSRAFPSQTVLDEDVSLLRPCSGTILPSFITLYTALETSPEEVLFFWWCDGSLFNLSNLRTKTGVQHRIVRYLLFADDAALVPHISSDLQDMFDMMNHMNTTWKAFFLTISEKGTVILEQCACGSLR